MVKWTEDSSEYDRVRNLMLKIELGSQISFKLKNGKTLKGHVAGFGTGTDVGVNLESGRGAIVTSMWGEIRVRLEDGNVVVVDAVDVQNAS